MPHLSPLSWIITSFMLYLILMMMLSNSWWSYLPNFPEMKPNSSKKMFPSWKW